MTKHIVTILLVFAVVLHTSAQKEIYFSNLSPDSIKVQQMQGIEIGLALYPTKIIMNLSTSMKDNTIPIVISYFNEKRIASTWTLISRIKLKNNLSKSPVFTYDSISHSYEFHSNSHYQTTYSLELGVEIEPRWYFGYKSRYQLGKAQLNSGWYLSLPLQLCTTLIDTFKYPQPLNQFINYNLPNLTLAPAIGYRQSVSKQLFFEANLKIAYSALYLYSIKNYVFVRYSYQYVTLLPELSFKAAYTFK
jgi:hypothetical protein